MRKAGKGGLRLSLASRILIMGRSGKVRPEAGYPQVTIRTRSHLIN
jgi:hypothetical protein